MLKRKLITTIKKQKQKAKTNKQREHCKYLTTGQKKTEKNRKNLEKILKDQHRGCEAHLTEQCVKQGESNRQQGLPQHPTN